MSSRQQKLNLARCFLESSGVYHRNPLTFLLAAIVMYGLSFASLFILAGPLEAGFTMMILRAIRGEDVKVIDLFRYFNRIGRLILLGFVRTVVELFLVLPLFLLYSPQSLGLQAALIGGVIFLLPSLLVGTWWLYVYPLALDRDLTFIESFRESFRIVNRNGLWIHLALFAIVIAVGTGAPLLVRSSGLVFVLTCILAPLVIGFVASGYHQVCDEE